MLQGLLAHHLLAACSTDLPPCRCYVCTAGLLPRCLPWVPVLLPAAHGPLPSADTSFCASLSPPSSCNHSPVPPSNECLINSIPSSVHTRFSTQVPLNCPYPALLCKRRQVIPIFSCPLRYYCLKFFLETPGFRRLRAQLSSCVPQ